MTIPHQGIGRGRLVPSSHKGVINLTLPIVVYTSETARLIMALKLNEIVQKTPYDFSDKVRRAMAHVFILYTTSSIVVQRLHGMVQTSQPRLRIYMEDALR